MMSIAPSSDDVMDIAASIDDVMGIARGNKSRVVTVVMSTVVIRALHVVSTSVAVRIQCA